MIKNLINLTDSEYRVMQLAAKGYSVNYISDKLFLAYSTVLTHFQNIYLKYGIQNNKTFNPRARAVFIFNNQEKLKQIGKFSEFQEKITNDIENYKQWIEDADNEMRI